MTRDEMIKHVGCGDVDAMGQCATCDAIRAALRAPAVTWPAETVRRKLAMAFAAGWDARSEQQGGDDYGPDEPFDTLQSQWVNGAMGTLSAIIAAPPAAGAPPALRDALAAAINAMDVAASFLGESGTADELRLASRKAMAALLTADAGAPPALVAQLEALIAEWRSAARPQKGLFGALATIKCADELERVLGSPAPAPVAGVVHSDSRNTSAVRSCDQAQGRSEKDAEDDPACPGSPRPSVASPAPAPVAPPAGREWLKRMAEAETETLGYPAPPAVAGGDAPFGCAECDTPTSCMEYGCRTEHRRRRQEGQS